MQKAEILSFQTVLGGRGQSLVNEISIRAKALRSVTANIGWYVVSILHDQPSCNVDITWPVEST